MRYGSEFEGAPALYGAKGITKKRRENKENKKKKRKTYLLAQRPHGIIMTHLTLYHFDRCPDTLEASRNRSETDTLLYSTSLDVQLLWRPHGITVRHPTLYHVVRCPDALETLATSSNPMTLRS